MKYVLAMALVGATSVTAAPYYVGENLQPKNHVSLGFNDTMTKKQGTTRTNTGNIAALELKAAYSPMENGSLRLGVPFYMSSKNATTTGSSRNALGNVSLGGTWSKSLETAGKEWTWGYALGMDLYAPTSRKLEGNQVGAANPTTDLYKFATKATAATPNLGAWIAKDMFSFKANVGGVYALVPKSATNRKNHHLNLVSQAGASWHATPNVQGNVEYNTIFLDGATTGSDKAFRHAVSPSISGNYEKMLASVYATLPLDKATRRITNVAFGLNAGYTF